MQYSVAALIQICWVGKKNCTDKTQRKGIVFNGAIQHIVTELLNQRMVVCLSVNPEVQKLKENFNFELSVFEIQKLSYRENRRSWRGTTAQHLYYHSQL